jgi:hypothetical protein
LRWRREELRVSELVGCWIPRYAGGVVALDSDGESGCEEVEGAAGESEEGGEGC